MASTGPDLKYQGDPEFYHEVMHADSEKFEYSSDDYVPFDSYGGEVDKWLNADDNQQDNSLDNPDFS